MSIVIGRESKYSLYDQGPRDLRGRPPSPTTTATPAGFIKLNALRLRNASASAKKKLGL